MTDITGIRPDSEPERPTGLRSELPDRTPEPDSYGRTDGRTHEERQDLRNHVRLSERARETAENQVNPGSKPTNSDNQFATRPETLKWLSGDSDLDFLPTGERWPIVRTGEREPIRWGKRLAVYKRDGFTCRVCGFTAAPKRADTRPEDIRLELDHAIPWSAGGPDHSSNLRTLCQPCNTARSNFDDGAHWTRLLPVTWWCVFCWADGMTYDEHRKGDTGSSWCASRFCAYSNPAFDVPRIVVADADALAYCAHCDANGYTTVTL